MISEEELTAEVTVTERIEDTEGTVSFADFACTRCGCVCDDLQVTVDAQRVLDFTPGCPLAESWLLSQTSGEEHPAARIANRSVPLVEAADEAAAILTRSRAPLIYGLSRSSTPGQRAATRLADMLGATIDTTASTCHAPSIIALQASGESTSSLGEVQNRSDLVIYWGSDPERSHPRHMERFVESTGMLIPHGRRDRHVVVVDVVETKSTAQADTFLRIEPGSDFDVLWTLRALVQGLEMVDANAGGVPLEQLAQLAERMKACRYGVVFFGLGLTRHSVAHANVEALLRLVTDLNAHTRFVVRRMRVPGDVAGADSVLCWQTGYPFSVNLARGYPRYNPGEYTANVLLERQEVDAVVLVGAEGVQFFTAQAQAYLATLPVVVLDHPGVKCPVPAAVHFTTAVYGVHRPGTAYRMDEVPIPLRGILQSPLPADHEVLALVRERVAKMV